MPSELVSTMSRHFPQLARDLAITTLGPLFSHVSGNGMIV